MDDLHSDDLYTFSLDSSAPIFVPVSFLGPLFCPPISLIFCYLAVCFPFQLLRSLSCCVGICLVPLPPSHFWFLRQRGSGSRNAVSSCARLLARRQLTDANLVIGCLSLLHFPWPRALFTPLPLLSSPSLSASLPLTSGINRAKLIPTFSRIMSASVVMQQEREREGREHEYVSDIFVHLCLRCCSHRRSVARGEAATSTKYLKRLPKMFELSSPALLLGVPEIFRVQTRQQIDLFTHTHIFTATVRNEGCD